MFLSVAHHGLHFDGPHPAIMISVLGSAGLQLGRDARVPPDLADAIVVHAMPDVHGAQADIVQRADRIENGRCLSAHTVQGRRSVVDRLHTGQRPQIAVRWLPRRLRQQAWPLFWIKSDR